MWIQAGIYLLAFCFQTLYNEMHSQYINNLESPENRTGPFGAPSCFREFFQLLL